MRRDVIVRRGLERISRQVAVAAGDIALYCDRVEHAEPVDQRLVASTGESHRESAVRIAVLLQLNLIAAYARRLDAIEQRRSAGLPDTFDGGAAAMAANTWRDLQVVQVAHDRDYHPDVVGLSRLDQVRHCAFHSAKLAGWIARAADDTRHTTELAQKRVPDLLLFGLKYATLAGVALDARELPDLSGGGDFPLRRVSTLRG